MATQQEIFDKLCMVDENVNKLVAWQSCIEERCQNESKIVNGIKNTLYGDTGAGGIVAQSNANTDARLKIERWSLKIFGSIIVVAVLAVAAAALAIWKTA